MAFVVGISPTLFQPVGSGSHLYPAHLHTVRSGHRVKGLTDSRGSFPLGLPCPRLLYSYYITSLATCQEFFLIFFSRLASADSNRLGIALFSQTISALSRSLALSLFVPLLYHNLGDLSRVFFEFLSNGLKVWWVPLALSTSLTLYHNLGDLSRGFPNFFLTFSRGSYWGGYSVWYFPLPLTMIVYYRPHTKSIGNVAQIREK